jgi:DNA-binding NarL/FixJ family response regulator
MNEHDKKIRVLIADDQPLMRDGLVSLLEVQPNLEIVGAVVNGKEAVEHVQLLMPDVVLMDIRMPIMDGIQATEIIRRNFPTCQVLMLTTFDDEDLIVQAILAGAIGYLLKTIPAGELAQTIKAAHHGIYQFDGVAGAVVVGRLAQQGRRDDVAKLNQRLTERQIDVLRLVARGATNKEIAHKLSISEGTVKNYISSILAELNLRDRTQAAIFAYKNGLL